MKKIGTVLSIFVLALSLVGCRGGSSDNSTLDTIKERDKLIVGVKNDRIDFGLQNTATGEYEGYEIDIAKEIARQILGDESKIEFVAVTAKTRTGLLDSGEVDLVIATFTITDERKESWNFSEPYYRDYVGIMTKAGRFSGLEDMDGTIIAVVQSSTSQDAVKESMEELGISIEFREYGTASEAIMVLNSGVVDGYSIDITELMSYLNDDLEILPDRFSPQEFGIATRKDDEEFSDFINQIIEDLHADGTLEEWQDAYGISQGD